MDTNNDENLIPPSNGYSPDSNSPKYYLKPKRHSDDYYIWNENGNFLNFEEFQFAIIVISASEASKIRSVLYSFCSRIVKIH